MKLYQNGIEVEETWGGHAPGCKSCREVDLSETRTFDRACVMGSQLLMEEAKTRAGPAARAKQKAIEEWAKGTGAFTEFDAKSKQPPKHVGE